MRQIFHLIVLISLYGLASCSSRNEQSKSSKINDSLWLSFVNAMELNDLNFLLANSLDSVRCIDCEPNNQNRGDEIYESKYLFNNFLTELKHLDNLSTAEFSTYQDSTLIRINYKIENIMIPEGAYNLIFTLEQRDGKYFLADRFFVP